MKKILEGIALTSMGIFLFGTPSALISGGMYGIYKWIMLPREEQWSDFGLIVAGAALGVVGLGISWLFPLARTSYKKREILKIPEKIPTEEFDEDSMRFILTDLPFNRLRLEVLRNMSDEIFPGWRIYPTQKKDAEKRFDVVIKEFEDASFPSNTQDPDPFMPLPMIDKFILRHHTRKLFQEGMIVGWRKTVWDMILFLGPRYLVAFPSGFIVATHMDGLRPVRSA